MTVTNRETKIRNYQVLNRKNKMKRLLWEDTTFLKWIVTFKKKLKQSLKETKGQEEQINLIIIFWWDIIINFQSKSLSTYFTRNMDCLRIISVWSRGVYNFNFLFSFHQFSTFPLLPSHNIFFIFLDFFFLSTPFPTYPLSHFILLFLPLSFPSS